MSDDPEPPPLQFPTTLIGDLKKEIWPDYIPPDVRPAIVVSALRNLTNCSTRKLYDHDGSSPRMQQFFAGNFTHARKIAICPDGQTGIIYVLKGEADHFEPVPEIAFAITLGELCQDLPRHLELESYYNFRMRGEEF